MAVSPYMREILGDPVYQNARNAYNSALQTGRLSLRDAIRQAAIGYGLDPTQGLPPELAGYAKDLDAATRNLAANNQMSSLAQARQGLVGGQQSLRYALAARGALGSGALPVGTTGLNSAYQTNTYNALQSTLAAIRAAQGNYTTLQAGAYDTYQNALNAVAARLANQPGAVYPRARAPRPIVGGAPHVARPAPASVPSSIGGFIR